MAQEITSMRIKGAGQFGRQIMLKSVFKNILWEIPIFLNNISISLIFLFDPASSVTILSNSNKTECQILYFIQNVEKISNEY